MNDGTMLHTASPAPLLVVRDLHVRYGGSHILQGLDLDVGANEVVALLGRNGMGKTTLVHAIMGMVRSSGTIRFEGTDVAGRSANRVARSGVAIAPQGRRIFSGLTVEENLRIVGQRETANAWTLDDIYELLPQLRERRKNRGDQLSGGEQQMLAIGRALISTPRLVLLDEPSEGLAPTIVERIGQLLLDLRRMNVSFLLVEQKVDFALTLADRAYVLNKGVIAFAGSSDELRADPELLESHLGLASAGGISP